MPYSLVEILVAGNPIATVPVGQQSFVDTAPTAGTYSVRVTCSGTSSIATCGAVPLAFGSVSGFTCEADLGTNQVNIAWTNNDTYDTLTLTRNGVAVTPLGRYFLRVVAMVFDRHLREQTRTKRAYSRTI